MDYEEIYFHEYSTDALLLHLIIRREAARSGHCTKWAAVGFSGLGRDRGNAALAELIDGGHVYSEEKMVPIADFGDAVVMGRQLWLFPVKPDAGRFDRLGPVAWASLRRRTFERDDFTCQYCGARGGKLECDHVIPISKGGTNEPGNLITACEECNRDKRGRMLEEWRRA